MRIIISLFFYLIITMPANAATYVLQAQPGVKATLEINGTSNKIIVNKQERSFDAGVFDMAMLTAVFNKYTYVCHLIFLPNNDWMIQPFYGDNCNFINHQENNIVKIVKPIIPSRFAALIPNRVYLLDYDKTTGNMLFRGNMPLTQGEKQRVDFAGLDDVFKVRVKQQIKTIKFPKKYIFVDVSLINNLPHSEGPQLHKEYISFDKNNRKLLWWGVQPVSTAKMPYDGNKKHIAKALAYTSLDHRPLPQLINKLRTLMSTKHKLPYIIYIHCTDGRDRTGLVAVSYLLAQYNIHLPKAYIYGTTIFNNEGITRRFVPITAVSGFSNALRWYCLYLHKDFDVGDCNAGMDRMHVGSDNVWQHFTKR